MNGSSPVSSETPASPSPVGADREGRNRLPCGLLGGEERRALRWLLPLGIPILLAWGWSITNLQGRGEGGTALAPMEASASLAAVMQRVVRYEAPQRFRILAEGAAVGACVVQIRRHEHGSPHELWFSGNMRLPRMPGPPLHVNATTRFSEDTSVQSCRIRAMAGGFALDATADAGSSEIVWRLSYGGVFEVEQRTPVQSLAGLALAGPLGLPGLGDWQPSDPAVIQRLAGAEPVTRIRLGRLGTAQGDVCFIVETTVSDEETVSAWILADGRIARVETSFGFVMEPVEASTR